MRRDLAGGPRRAGSAGPTARRQVGTRCQPDNSGCVGHVTARLRASGTTIARSPAASCGTEHTGTTGRPPSTRGRAARLRDCTGVAHRPDGRRCRPPTAVRRGRRRRAPGNIAGCGSSPVSAPSWPPVRSCSAQRCPRASQARRDRPRRCPSFPRWRQPHQQRRQRGRRPRHRRLRSVRRSALPSTAR